MAGKVTVVDHPLVQSKLTEMRRTGTRHAEFSRRLNEIAALLAFEAFRGLTVSDMRIETPLTDTTAPGLDEGRIVLVSILRAGNGLLEAMHALVPRARAGHIGIYRDPETLAAIEYYFKVPKDLRNSATFVVDPTLATGNTAVAALERVKEAGARDLTFVCVLAAPEGIAALHKRHADVPIVTAAIDSHLNERGYIVPGFGDAGDRLYGTE